MFLYKSSRHIFIGDYMYYMYMYYMYYFCISTYLAVGRSPFEGSYRFRSILKAETVMCAINWKCRLGKEGMRKGKSVKLLPEEFEG
jgi:hypothetical protein